MNQIVQQTIPYAQLRLDAQTCDLSFAVVGFIQFFFGYEDPS